MSIYAYLSCYDCHQQLWLGKALHENHRPIYFHIGGAEEAPHWLRQQLNQVLWKFLADHTTHRIDVRLEQDMTEDMDTYATIGGDGVDDISFADYLRNWPGLKADI